MYRTVIARQIKTMTMTNTPPILSTKIAQNTSLRKYIKDIYIKTGSGFATSLSASMITPFVGGLLSIAVPIPVICIGTIGFSFYSVYKMAELETKTIKTNDGLYEEKNILKEKWYNAFCIANGITISPLIGVVLMTNPIILPIALTTTAATFAGATYVAINQKDLNLIQYQGPLVGGVCGLIASSIVQIIAHLSGFHMFGIVLDLVTTGASVAIFSCLIAVDTQIAIKNYYDEKLDSINASMELLLDATNLLTDFIKIFKNTSN